RIQTVEQLAADELAGHRAAALLASLFGIAALLLVALGLYGTLAHQIARGRREIGVRLALGASSSLVARRVLWRGLLPTTVGTLVGLGAAVALSRYVEDLLWDVVPTDPLTFAAVPVTIVCVALLAGWLPARRAARTDPARSLRAE
ncbi:MAG TPA: FtsX-like permease family protein, partial [Longimicrobiales bacterium]|nr:FtsX-like permease family protein [Longimicrobiales bacterium]